MDKFRTNITLFVKTNLSELIKKLEIALEPCAELWLLIALGLLGRGFESCHPDSYNQIYRKISQPAFFI